MLNKLPLVKTLLVHKNKMFLIKKLSTQVESLRNNSNIKLLHLGCVLIFKDFVLYNEYFNYFTNEMFKCSDNYVLYTKI